MLEPRQRTSEWAFISTRRGENESHWAQFYACDNDKNIYISGTYEIDFGTNLCSPWVLHLFVLREQRSVPETQILLDLFKEGWLDGRLAATVYSRIGHTADPMWRIILTFWTSLSLLNALPTWSLMHNEDGILTFRRPPRSAQIAMERIRFVSRIVAQYTGRVHDVLPKVGRKDFKAYNIICVLGEGSFGKVILFKVSAYTNWGTTGLSWCPHAHKLSNHINFILFWWLVIWKIQTFIYSSHLGQGKWWQFCL